MQTVFIRRKQGFNTNEINLLNELKRTYPVVTIDNVEIYYYYELINIDIEDSKKVINHVISDSYVDEVVAGVKPDEFSYFIEPLANQLDIRKESALDCLKLLGLDPKSDIKTATLYKFKNISESNFKLIKPFFVNKIENQLKTKAKKLSAKPQVETAINDFIAFDDTKLSDYHTNNGFAMDMDDFKFLHNYYQQIQKNPKLGELKILDTYWSDHCRHTTFNTSLTNLKIEDPEVLKGYKELQEYITGDLTLMKMASCYAKDQIKTGQYTKKEDTVEDNAISIVINEDETEYLLQFKNETHNHPTEIEPFGGAATCVGGAIRDPLSGRAYVYQSMRIAGVGDIFQNPNDTLDDKLYQRTISQKAAHGYSSYGNQIGIPTMFNKEIYDPSYVAKHLELGCVVGVCKKENVTRSNPSTGDLIILLGGLTGMDGIGGATGSSKLQTSDALTELAAEVQKGNAPQQRNLLRLFTQKEFSKVIKKSNDFGAGGISVCVLELAGGVDINLEQVQLKTANMSVSDIALSESQERMAIVIDPSDYPLVEEMAKKHNVLYSKIGVVTDQDDVNMYYNQELIYSFKRDLLDSNGAKHSNDVFVPKLDALNLKPYSTYDSVLLDRNLNFNQMQDQYFDATVLGNTILMPYGGKDLNIKTQVMMSKIHGTQNMSSVVGYGFNPFVMDQNPYAGAQLAVIDAITKQITMGIKLENMVLSFQEYFKRLNSDSTAYGRVFMALLGGFMAQKNLGVLALGGKDSMSGTYHEIDVVDTFVAFSLGYKDNLRAIKNYFVSPNETIYITGCFDKIDYDGLKQSYDKYLANFDDVSCAFSLGDDPIVSGLQKMSLDGINYELSTDLDTLMLRYGSIIFTSSNPNLDFEKLGVTSNIATEKSNFTPNYFEEIYPQIIDTLKDTEQNNLVNYDLNPLKKEIVTALIVIFEGTNSYLELERSFKLAGAKVELVVFNDKYGIDQAIENFTTKLKDADILAFAGGFSKADEPDGSAKYIVNFLKNKQIALNIDLHLAQDKLIFGVCNGFQALLKAGLLTDVEDSATLFYNDCDHHISSLVRTKFSKSNAPFFTGMGEVEFVVPISHGEGKFICSEAVYQNLLEKGQVISTYQNCNPNQSYYNIESIVSSCGRIYGKMGHSERCFDDLYQNCEGQFVTPLFKNMVNYFKEA